MASNPYWVGLKIQAGIVLQYRAQAWAGVFTQAVFGLIRVYLIVALFKSQPVQNISLSQSVSYIWFTQILLTLIAWGPDPLMSAMVKDGTLAYEMVRPVRLSLMWYMRSLAFRGFMPIMRGVPILILASFLPEPLGITWPVELIANPMDFAAWAILNSLGLVLAWLLAGALNNLINIAVVALMSDDGIIRLAPLVMIFFGGLILPMPLFPEGLQAVVKYLPFVGIMDMPARLFSGHLFGWEALATMGVQGMWLVAIVLINDIWLERRLKRAVIQGG